MSLDLQAGHSEDGDSGFQQESLEFQRRISHKNGLSDCTYFPPALKLDPPHADLDAARDEAKMVLFGAIREVLNRTGVLCRMSSLLKSQRRQGG